MLLARYAVGIHGCRNRFQALQFVSEFAKEWAKKGPQGGMAPFCNEEEIGIIQKCGIDRLYNAIDGRLNHTVRLPTGEDFNKALDKLCRLVESRALTGHRGRQI